MANVLLYKTYLVVTLFGSIFKVFSASFAILLHSSTVEQGCQSEDLV